ncbi:MAG: hypothetical protein NTV92_06185 [Candidatus Bipolaricaulota bacterium]|nr:hypothetical protein [Candidatus Bipolaricaulota bacterium]
MPAPYIVTVDREVASRVLPVVVWADGIVPPATSSRLELLEESLARAGRGEELVSEIVRGQVRSMLRHGNYKPTGRGKPASEFLLQAALRGEFPRVNGPVDANNAISLASGLPGSIFDADLTGPRLFLRYGRAGESYVFNPSGQSIDLMATKIQSGTQNVVAILYVPRSFGDETALGWAARFADALASSCSAHDAGFRVVQEGPAGYPPASVRPN